MRVHRAGGVVEKPVGRYAWHKEPCCQPCNSPGRGQTARLDDVANDVIYRQV